MEKKAVLLLVTLVIILGSIGVAGNALAYSSDQVVMEMVNFGKEGKVKGCPFTVGTDIKNIINEWGAGNSIEIPEMWGWGDSYYFYSDKHVGYKEDDKTKKVRSLLYKPQFGIGVNLSQVEKVLGKPDKESIFYVTYYIEGYELTFFYLSHRLSENMFVKRITVSKKA